MTRALIAGADNQEIADLALAAHSLLGAECSFLALQLDTSTTDPELAWGTSRPVVRQLVIEPEPGDVPARYSVTMSTGIEHPLGTDGDAAPTILDAAHANGVDLIVTAVRSQGWFARVFSGSAALDLLDGTDLPVLLINRTNNVIARTSGEDRLSNLDPSTPPD